MPRLRLIALTLLLIAAGFPTLSAWAWDAAGAVSSRTLYEQTYPNLDYRDSGDSGYFAAGAAMPDGGLTVVGSMDHKTKGVTRTAAWVLRFDRNGVLLWQKEYAVPGHRLEPFAVSALPDNGLVVSGWDRRTGHRLGQGLVMRLTAKGRLVWRRVIAIRGDLDFGGVAATPDGGAVAVGRWDGPRDSLHDGTRALLVRVDGRGRTMWRRWLPVKLGSIFYQLYPNGHGGFVTLGTTTTKDRGDQATATAFGLERNGRIRWRQDFGPATGQFDVTIGYTPGEGFAIARLKERRILVVERWDTKRHLLWSTTDRDIGHDPRIWELLLDSACFRLRPSGGLLLALRGPIELDSPGLPGTLLDYDSTGVRRGRWPLDTPKAGQDQFPDTIVRLGNGEIAVVGGISHYPKQGFNPFAFSVWLRAWRFGKE